MSNLLEVTTLYRSMLICMLLISNGMGAVLNLVEYESGDVPIILSMPHSGTQANVPVDVENEREHPNANKVEEYYVPDIADGVIARLVSDYGLRPYRVEALFPRTHIDANRENTGDLNNNEAFEDPDAEIYYLEYHNRITAFRDECLEKFGKVLMLDLHGHKQDPNDGPETLYRGTRNGASVDDLVSKMGWDSIVGAEGIYGYLENAGYPIEPANTELPLDGNKPEVLFIGGWTSKKHGSEGNVFANTIQIEISHNTRYNDGLRDEFIIDFADAIGSFYESYYKDLVIDNVVGVQPDGVYTEGDGNVVQDWKDEATLVDNYAILGYEPSHARSSNTLGDFANWVPDAVEEGVYEVYAWWSNEVDMNTKVAVNDTANYSLTSLADSFSTTVDQNENAGQWNLLYTGFFEAGESPIVKVSHESGVEPTVSDAVMFRLLSTDENYPSRYPNWGEAGDLIIDREHLSVLNSDNSLRYEEVGSWGVSNAEEYHELTGFPDTRSVKTIVDGDKVVFRPEVPQWQGGYHKVYVWWANKKPGVDEYYYRDPKALCRIVHRDGVTEKTINQRYDGGQWNLISTVYLEPGTSSFVEIERGNQVDNYPTVADAVKFEYVGDTPPKPSDIIIDYETNGYTQFGSWGITSSPNHHAQDPEKDSRARITAVTGDTVEWRLNLEDWEAKKGSQREVFVWWANNKPGDEENTYTRDPEATFRVYYAGGVSEDFVFNQRYDGGQWISLGTYEFDSGTDGFVELERVTNSGSLKTVADAVKFVYLPPEEESGTTDGDSGGDGGSGTGSSSTSTSGGSSTGGDSTSTDDSTGSDDGGSGTGGDEEGATGGDDGVEEEPEESDPEVESPTVGGYFPEESASGEENVETDTEPSTTSSDIESNPLIDELLDEKTSDEQFVDQVTDVIRSDPLVDSVIDQLPDEVIESPDYAEIVIDEMLDTILPDPILSKLDNDPALRDMLLESVIEDIRSDESIDLGSSDAVNSKPHVNFADSLMQESQNLNGIEHDSPRVQRNENQVSGNIEESDLFQEGLLNSLLVEAVASRSKEADKLESGTFLSDAIGSGDQEALIVAQPLSSNLEPGLPPLPWVPVALSLLGVLLLFGFISRRFVE